MSRQHDRIIARSLPRGGDVAHAQPVIQFRYDHNDEYCVVCATGGSKGLDLYARGSIDKWPRESVVTADLNHLERTTT